MEIIPTPYETIPAQNTPTIPNEFTKKYDNTTWAKALKIEIKDNRVGLPLASKMLDIIKYTTCRAEQDNDSRRKSNDEKYSTGITCFIKKGSTSFRANKKIKITEISKDM